jgi:hypothetical protein
MAICSILQPIFVDVESRWSAECWCLEHWSLSGWSVDMHSIIFILPYSQLHSSHNTHSYIHPTNSHLSHLIHIYLTLLTSQCTRIFPIPAILTVYALIHTTILRANIHPTTLTFYIHPAVLTFIPLNSYWYSSHRAHCLHSSIFSHFS